MRYLKWVSGFPSGDFGWSLEWNSPVLPLVLSRMGYTILVGGLSLLFMVIVSLPIGIYSATHQYSLGDHALSFLGFLGLSLPGFLLALLWMFFGVVILRIPVGGEISQQYADAPWSLPKFLDYLNHLWPAAVVLALASTAQLQRIMRNSMLETLGQQFITTARAKGLKESKVVNKYAARVSINPVISVMADGGSQNHLRIDDCGHRHVDTHGGSSAAACFDEPGHVLSRDVFAVHGVASDDFQFAGRYRAGLGRPRIVYT